MDRMLKPERFEVEPNSPSSEKHYKHWKMTFSNYLESTLADTDGEEANARKKWFALINCVSADVYEIFSDASDFTTGIQMLDNAYIKPENVVFNRHRLISCKQEPLQSVDSFLQELERIAKTCDFKAVNAEENKQQYIRDAFINGISSPTIRQRLLESGALALKDARAQARSLEQAQKQSASYEHQPMAAMAKSSADHETSDLLAAMGQTESNSKRGTVQASGRATTISVERPILEEIAVSYLKLST